MSLISPQKAICRVLTVRIFIKNEGKTFLQLIGNYDDIKDPKENEIS